MDGATTRGVFRVETPPTQRIRLCFTSVLLRDAPGVLIAAKTGKFRVTEMIAIGPLKIFDSRNDFGSDPHALLHVVCS